MRCSCVSCLCNYCTKTDCRYIKIGNRNICSVRCIYIDNSVHYEFKPVLVCDKFVHRTIHKTYKIKLLRSGKRSFLDNISVSDFLKLLGGDKNDNKGN